MIGALTIFAGRIAAQEQGDPLLAKGNYLWGTPLLKIGRAHV